MSKWSVYDKFGIPVIDPDFDVNNVGPFKNRYPVGIDRPHPAQPVKKLTAEEIKILEDHMRKQGKL